MRLYRIHGHRRNLNPAISRISSAPYWHSFNTIMTNYLKNLLATLCIVSLFFFSVAHRAHASCTVTLGDGAPGSSGVSQLAYGAQPAGGHNYLATQFTPGCTGTFTTLTVNARYAAGTANLNNTIYIESDSSGHPSGTVLYTSNTFILTGGNTFTDYTVTFPSAVSVTSGTVYWLDIGYQTPSASDFPGWSSHYIGSGSWSWQSDDNSSWVTGSYQFYQTDAVINITTSGGAASPLWWIDLF